MSGNESNNEPPSIFIEALARAKTDEDVAEVWHAKLEGSEGQLDADAERARESLLQRNMKGVIEFASRDARARAEAAARAIRATEEEFPSQP